MSLVVHTQVRHIYDFKHIDRASEGPCSGELMPQMSLYGGADGGGRMAPVAMAVKGQRVQVALVHEPGGTGSALYSDLAEQFHFVLQGTLIADIDGQVLRVSKGHVLHIPAGMPHSQVAEAGEEAIFYTARDARHALGNVPVAATFDGSRSSIAPGGLPAPQSKNVTGRKVRYVYKIDSLDEVPEGDCSAKVTPNNFISKKSSSFGAALTGERLHVGRIHKGVGSGTKLHTHPNEQFSFVLEGTMLYEIDGHKDSAPPGSVTHLPPGIQHSALASADGDVVTFVAKDTSHGMSGPPVDGIEDGPIYLPGFRPAAK